MEYFAIRPLSFFSYLVVPFIMVATAHSDEGDDKHRELIEAATQKGKADVHIIFTQTIRSKEQKDWRDAYSATVEVFEKGKSIGKFRGSTLPNFMPGRGKPKDWKYSVVEATCAFPASHQGRVYTWTRTLRADGKRPCLRLAPKVPTVAVSSERAADMILADLIDSIVAESRAKHYVQFADNILVHSGHSQDWRGSAGCLTIHPDDSEKFFSLLKEGVKGTLEINRGFEDGSTKSSHCY